MTPAELNPYVAIPEGSADWIRVNTDASLNDVRRIRLILPEVGMVHALCARFIHSLAETVKLSNLQPLDATDHDRLLTFALERTTPGRLDQQANDGVVGCGTPGPCSANPVPKDGSKTRRGKQTPAAVAG